MARPRRDRLGEGPIWVPERARLFWVDIAAPALNWLDLAGGAAVSYTHLTLPTKA